MNSEFKRILAEGSESEFDERIKDIEFTLFKGIQQTYIYCNAVFIDVKRTLEIFKEKEEA